MIILPPEEPKKPSFILKWTLRTLLALVILFAMMMFVLSLIAGTSDAHRHGLEQAFSDILGAKVTIGTLHSFNIFPQFAVDMENVRGSYEGSGGEFQAERVVLAFSFADIVMRRRTIENFQMTNMSVTPGIVGDEALTLAIAGIAPPQNGNPPAFAAHGQYGAVPVVFHLELEPVIGAPRPSYSIGVGRPASLALGEFEISGKFAHTALDEPAIGEGVIRLNDSEIGKGQLALLGGIGTKTIKMDFEGTDTKGQFSYTPSTHQQVWNFDTLPVASLLNKDPLWARLYGVYHAMAQAKPADDVAEPEQIKITVKNLTGDIAGEALQGQFVHTPGALMGWWDGKLTVVPETKQKDVETGQVQCGLLNLQEAGSIWATKNALIKIDPVMVRSQLDIDTGKGHVNFGIERVASDGNETFGIDMSPLAKSAAALQLTKDHACGKLLKIQDAAP